MVLVFVLVFVIVVVVFANYEGFAEGRKYEHRVAVADFQVLLDRKDDELDLQDEIIDDLVAVLDRFAGDGTAFTYDIDWNHRFGTIVSAECRYCGAAHGTPELIQHDETGSGCFVADARRILKEYETWRRS